MIKYPRTPHLPDSPGMTNDDRVIKDLSLLAGSRVIITEKMDGENTTFYRDGIHARSLGYSAHPSRSWMRGFHAEIKFLIPDGWRICGENLYAKHSIHYQSLPHYFMAFSVWDEDNICLSWAETTDFLDDIGILYVPVLAEGSFQESLEKVTEIDTSKVEGYVIRKADRFDYDDFDRSVVKWVRKNHVQTDDHWLYQAVTKNILAEKP